jgi:hypothetical protein
MASVLVDSNVLLRSVQPAHPQFSVASAAIDDLLRRNIDLCVARQNRVEFWVVATRPLANNGLEMNPVMVAGEIRKLRKVFRLLEGVPGVADLGKARKPISGLGQARARCSSGGDDARL